MSEPARTYVDEVYIDNDTAQGDCLVLLQDIKRTLKKIKPKWERVVIVILAEEIRREPSK